MITNKVGNMFHKAPPSSVLAHACNCRGSWSAGVAREFADYYYEAYQKYANACQKYGNLLLGDSMVIDEVNGDKIVCLFTSKGFGEYLDSEEEILEATETAIEDLIQKVGTEVEIHMPKINSGLFRVPWEKTAAILEKSPGNFVVWSLE